MRLRLTPPILALLSCISLQVAAQDTVATPRKALPMRDFRPMLPPLQPAQSEHDLVRGHYTFGTILDGDTVPMYNLREVTVYASGMLLTKSEIRQNAKLIRNVKLMLPYAQEGRRRLDALELEIGALPKKQRKAAIKQAEQKLMNDYKGELSKYTFSQGLVLIKLIDRETNRSAYAIVGELRGSLRAGMYQTMAKLFGYNLKETFDPKRNKKDDLIDRICISIERGQI